MKALVIADDEKIIKKIDSTLKKFGYDTIVYRWLLKALDNIEEIAPHLIVISTEDYPRHWKTLAQFSEIGLLEPPKIVLFTGKNFSEEESNKAKALDIAGTFKNDDLDDSDNIKAFEDILSSLTSKKDENKTEPSGDFYFDESSTPVSDIIPDYDHSIDTSKDKYGTETDEQKNIPCSFIFTNPVTLTLVSGVARNFNGETLEFVPDIPEFIKSLTIGTNIKHATLKLSEDIEPIDSIKSVSATVISNESEKLVLKIII